MAGSPPTPSAWSWLRERLFPRGTNLIQWASFVILISMMILYVLETPPVSQFQFISTMVALAALLVINIVLDDLKTLIANEQTSIWIIMMVSTVLAFYTIIVGQLFIGVYILFMIIAQANAMLPLKPALGVSIALLGGYLGFLALSGFSAGDIQVTAVGLLIGATFTITLSQVLQRFAEQTDRANSLLEQLQKANAELLAARQKEKELTIAEERVRMARDLHDGLGHHLTALSIQLQAAEKLVPINPELAAEAVHNARSEVQAALKEVRQSVGALREAPVDIQDLPQTLAGLVREIGKRSGIDAQFELTGQARPISPAAAITLFRTAQEGLTNVQKHAQAVSRICVRLVYNPHEVALSVEDDGQNTPSGNLEGPGRFGLAGLHERAHLLGGELAYGPLSSGGFFVRLRLPLDANQQGAAL